MKDFLIEPVAQIITALVLTAISLFGAWLGAKLEKHLKLKNTTSALDSCLKMTQVTVGELQQKFVDAMKAANEDGKLTEDEIKELNASLIAHTKEKLTPSIVNVIVSAGIDINQFILDAGENYVQELKHE